MARSQSSSTWRAAAQTAIQILLVLALFACVQFLAGRHNVRFDLTPTGRFTIKLGPLSYDDYLSFLPGGSRRPLVKGIVDTFTRGIYDVMLELHVKKDEAPRLRLSADRPSVLGRTAWLGGMRREQFVITVPLEEKKQEPGADDDDQDRGEPPPLL